MHLCSKSIIIIISSSFFTTIPQTFVSLASRQHPATLTCIAKTLLKSHNNSFFFSLQVRLESSLGAVSSSPYSHGKKCNLSNKLRSRMVAIVTASAGYYFVWLPRWHAQIITSSSILDSMRRSVLCAAASMASAGQYVVWQTRWHAHVRTSCGRLDGKRRSVRCLADSMACAG